MTKIWKTISRKTLIKTPWLTFKHDRFYLPSKKVGNYYYVYTSGSVMVIPILSNKKFVLVKQYRYLNKKESIEFPAGGIKKNQSPLSAAKAELEEETGYQAKDFIKIGKFNPYNGVTNEICHVFIAKNLIRSKQKLDATEQITIIIKSLRDIKKMILSGKIWDGMTIASWTLLDKWN